MKLKLWLCQTLLLATISCASWADNRAGGTSLEVGQDQDETGESCLLDEDFESPTSQSCGIYTDAMGNNPLITTRYSADPTARIFDDILYLYPSTDIDGEEEISFNGFCMPGYYAYSTENLMDWKDWGKLFGQEDVEWAIQDKYCMWAPDCVKYGDKYYYYFPTLAQVGDFKIGVAISDAPEGPFVLESNFIEGISNIDPNVFIDDDGKAYITTGGGHINFKMAELDPSMTKIVGEAFELLGPEYVEGDYKEAPFIFKRGDIYYLTYPYSLSGGGSNLHYAVSDNVKGPYTPKGQFLGSVNCWTSHHSIVEYNGEWILFYHSNQISGEDKRRSVCADYISFSDDGDIIPVTQTLRGVGAVPAWREIQIDRSSFASGVTVEKISADFPANWILKSLSSSSVIRYDRVDFSSQEYTKINIRCNATTAGGIVTIKDYSTDEVIAKVEIPSTDGEWRTYQTTISGSVPSAATNLMVRFSDGMGDTQIDWIRFL
ncbi:MAG: family 43 glycosylhydrolase [Rikenellaceae bacterium]